MSDPAPSSTSAFRPLSLAFLGDPNSVHLRRWMTFFAARGHRVTLLLGNDQLLEPGLSDDIAVERFRRISARGRFPPASFLPARQSIRRAVARTRPDVINAHFLTVNGWHAWISGFHPYVVTLWGSDILIAPKRWRAVKLLARITLRAADMVMANSEMLMRGALELGVPVQKAEMVQFGVNFSEFAAGPDPTALRARLGLGGRRVVFSPRAVDPLYRQGIVVQALAQLPPDVIVLMSRLRARPGEIETIERTAESMGVADRVMMLPEIEQVEMADFYRLADVVVSVPELDSTAAVLLESRACERPIVASDLPSMREWLWDLDPAMLVPVDDPDATAAALRRALDASPDERRDLGARARRIVVERADQARSLAHVESLYLNLADRTVRHGD